MSTEVTKQLAFRLPIRLVGELDKCVASLQLVGLNLNRSDLVRMLLRIGLDETQCDVRRLFTPRKRRPKSD
jgi:hypothetical protein